MEEEWTREARWKYSFLFHFLLVLLQIPPWAILTMGPINFYFVSFLTDSFTRTTIILTKREPSYDENDKWNFYPNALSFFLNFVVLWPWKLIPVASSPKKSQNYWRKQSFSKSSLRSTSSRSNRGFRHKDVRASLNNNNNRFLSFYAVKSTFKSFYGFGKKCLQPLCRELLPWDMSIEFS